MMLLLLRHQFPGFAALAKGIRPLGVNRMGVSAGHATCVQSQLASVISDGLRGKPSLVCRER
jgi:hypothetical protein